MSVGPPEQQSRQQPEQAGGGKPAPPSNVLVAFVLCLVTAVMWIVHVVISLPNRQQLVAVVKQAENTGFSPAQLQSVASTALVVTVVLTVVLALVCAFFGWQSYRGRNWARMVLTVIAAFGLVGTLGSGFWVGPVVGALAVVAMFLPSSNAYFAAAKRFRAK